MKNTAFLSILLTGSMALTACGGGDSDSSGSTDNQPSKPTPTVASTTPTTPTTPTTLSACEVNGSNIFGKVGSACTFSIDKFNNGATQTLTCNTDGSGKIGSGISFRVSFTLNGTTIRCK